MNGGESDDDCIARRTWRMLHPQRSRARLLAVSAAATVLALGATAHAGLKESRTCRNTIGTELAKVIKSGLKAADDCHKAKDKVCTAPEMGGSDREACTVLPDLDQPKAKYAGQKAKSADKLQGVKGKCLVGIADDVLANYPGADIDALLYPLLDGDVAGSSNAIGGVADLECNKVKAKCHQTILKARADIVDEIIKGANKCQKAIDKSGTIFGPLDPSCVASPAPKSSVKSAAKIQKDCVDKGLTGADVGACDPLPGCIVNAATQMGLGLAPAIYSQVGFECGNGLLEGNEQCDDHNVVSGDGCSADCETEGDTCDGNYSGPGGVNGIRRVVISLSTPEPLGGLEINLDYPQYQAGLPGIGNSSIVNGRFTAIQSADLAAINDSGSDVKAVLVNLGSGFMNGDLAQIDFDNCVAMSMNVCNRYQNAIGCCSNEADPTQFAVCSGDGTTVCRSDADCAPTPGGVCGPPVLCDANPPTCGTPPAPGVLGKCSTNGGCPGDNACVAQISTVRPCRAFRAPRASPSCRNPPR
jgi:cysteine-rich repeat protein